MKNLFFILLTVCLISKLSAQDFKYYSLTRADSITIYYMDNITKRLPNEEEINQLDYMKFIFPHNIKLDNASSEFSFPFDSLDQDYRPDFEESVQNLEMIQNNDSLKFIDTPSGYIFYYGIINNEYIDFNCYMAHLSIKDGELDENYSRWYIRFDTANISEFKSEMTNTKDSLGIINFTLRLKKAKTSSIYNILKKENNYCVYPNPFYESVKIDFSQMKSKTGISVFTLDGKLIYKRDFKNTETIDLNLPIPSGKYVLQVIVDEEQLNQTKLIKE